MGAHPLPPTPTPLTFDHAWRLEPSDRRRTGCDLMCAHKRVRYRARHFGGDDQVRARAPRLRLITSCPARTNRGTKKLPTRQLPPITAMRTVMTLG